MKSNPQNTLKSPVCHCGPAESVLYTILTQRLLNTFSTVQMHVVRITLSGCKLWKITRCDAGEKLAPSFCFLWYSRAFFKKLPFIFQMLLSEKAAEEHPWFLQCLFTCILICLIWFLTSLQTCFTNRHGRELLHVCKEKLVPSFII